jgi:hypothetical protein
MWSRMRLDWLQIGRALLQSREYLGRCPYDVPCLDVPYSFLFFVWLHGLFPFLVLSCLSSILCFFGGISEA